MFFPQRDPDRLAPAVAHVKVGMMSGVIGMLMMMRKILILKDGDEADLVLHRL